MRWKHLFRDWILYNPLVWRVFTRRRLMNWRILRRPGEVVGAGLAIKALVARMKVDLTMLHFFGGSDADEVADQSVRSGIPYAVLNHFSNDRFLNLSIRKHVMFAAGVAGVSRVDLPRYVRRTFVNLSDGIDIDFFHPSKGARRSQVLDTPLVLLPARIVRTKGHLDLIKAAFELKKTGANFRVGFAGRRGSPMFEEELRTMIETHGLSECVSFLGELSTEGLRDWYKTSSIVAFPTYHHEGLPRVLLEAQAMEVPIIAYASGGTADSVVPGKSGFLLQTGDVGGLVAKLRELLNNKEMCRSMGRNGRTFVEDGFSLEALAKRHEEFYANLIFDRTGLQSSE
jgi:glycosyltransferase involved in cell wall biosynthesis